MWISIACYKIEEDFPPPSARFYFVEAQASMDFSTNFDPHPKENLVALSTCSLRTVGKRILQWHLHSKRSRLNSPPKNQKLWPALLSLFWGKWKHTWNAVQNEAEIHNGYAEARKTYRLNIQRDILLDTHICNFNMCQIKGHQSRISEKWGRSKVQTRLTLWDQRLAAMVNMTSANCRRYSLRHPSTLFFPPWLYVRKN